MLLYKKKNDSTKSYKSSMNDVKKLVHRICGLNFRTSEQARYTSKPFSGRVGVSKYMMVKHHTAKSLKSKS